MTELPILTQRRIEAAFARGVFAEMEAEFGAEAARAVLARAVIRMARESAARLAAEAEEGVSPLDAFRAVLPRWATEDALRIDVLQSTETALDFNVTRCRYAEMYREMGLAELGSVLSCNRDGAFCQGFDPNLTLERTQTLMQGASHCDFRYRFGPT